MPVVSVGPAKLAKAGPNGRKFAARHYTLEGRRSEPTFFKQKDARSFLAGLPEIVPARNLTFDMMIESFKPTLAMWGMYEHSQRVYESLLDRYAVPYFHNVPIGRIDEPVIAQYRRDLAAKHSYGVTTMVMSLVSRAFDQAVDDELLSVSPFKHLRPVPIDLARAWDLQKKKKPSLPTRERVAELLLRSTGIVRIIVHLALLAGLRSQEILALRWRHAANGILSVEQAVNVDKQIDEPKTRAGRRSFAMVPELIEALDVWKAGRVVDPEDFVIRRPGEPAPTYQQMRRWVNWEQVRLGLGEWTPDYARVVGATCMHEMRHAAAALWIWAGIPEFVVSAWMGHATAIFTLNVYAYLFEEMELGLPVWTVNAEVGE